MKRLPKIANVQCSRLHFQPGDRVIVRTFQKLDRDQVKKLRKTVQQWAGSDVEILIVDCTLFDITIDKGKR